MSTPKASTPLSLKLKLFLGYLYLGVAGSVLMAFILLFSSDQIPKDGDLANPANRTAAVIISVIFAALYTWVIYLLHKRRSQVPIAFIILVITSYGLDNIQSHSSDIVSPTTPLTILFTALTISIVLFLLQSKEVKSQLKNKGWF